MSEYKLYSPIIQDPVAKQFYKRELNTHTGIVVRTQGGHCYINGSETTLTENLMRQRDQYKAERDTLKDKLNQAYEDNYKLEGQLHDMTKQRDTLIDDIAVLKANISRLERENGKQQELLEKFSGFINFKLWANPSNNTYKHYRSELDKLGVK